MNEISKSDKEITVASPERVEWLTKSQPKFRDLTPNFNHKTWRDIEKLLFGCSYTIGVSNPPEPEMLQSICRILKNQHPDVNASEVMEAFDMYAGQKLDFKTSHYNSFDALFVSNVVTSYKRYRATELSKIKRVTFDESKSRVEKAELLAYYERELFQKFNEFKKTKQLNWDLMKSNALYKQLEEMGVIEISVEEKKLIASDVLKSIKLNIASIVKDGKAKKNLDGEFDIDKTFFQNKCRQETFFRWIKEMDFADEDIKTMVIDKLNKQ